MVNKNITSLLRRKKTVHQRCSNVFRTSCTYCVCMSCYRLF